MKIMLEVTQKSDKTDFWLSIIPFFKETEKRKKKEAKKKKTVTHWWT